VNYDNSLVVTITVTCYSRALTSGDHLFYMWRHLQAATLAPPPIALDSCSRAQTDRTVF